MEFKISRDYQREINKLSLNTFSFDKNNALDSPVDKLLESIKKNIDDMHSSLCDIHKSPEHNSNLAEKYEEAGSSLWEYGHSLSVDLQYSIDEQRALTEIKIIYAFKHFEINLKKLLSGAFNDSAAKKIFRWEDFKSFLESKTIKLEDVRHYKEIYELKEINNALKHSETFDKASIKKIYEFKGKKEFLQEDLEAFYTRVKFAPQKFLQSIGGKIYDNLYTFDWERLDMMAEKLALRMEKEDAEKFIEILRDKYGQ